MSNINVSELKPFNLDRALAGDLFVRKHDFLPPSEWHYFKTMNSQPVVCVFHGETSEYCINGSYDLNMSSRPEDLVMLPKKKTLIIGIAKAPDMQGDYQTTTAYDANIEQTIKTNQHINQQFNFVKVEVEVDE